MSEMLLKHNLKALRLPTMLNEHARLAREAADTNQTYDDYLLKLARHDDYVRRTLVVLQEMLGLFVRAYYNHTPRVPPGERAAFRAAGKARFESFVEALAEHCGPGRSMLDQVPAWQRAANEPAADDAKPDREAADDADSINDA